MRAFLVGTWTMDDALRLNDNLTYPPMTISVKDDETWRVDFRGAAPDRVKLDESRTKATGTWSLTDGMLTIRDWDPYNSWSATAVPDTLAATALVGWGDAQADVSWDEVSQTLTFPLVLASDPLPVRLTKTSQKAT